jgi:hypothetical protein
MTLNAIIGNTIGDFPMRERKPGQTEEEAVIEMLLAMGCREFTAEEKNTEWYAREMRDFLRIDANDDTRIPAPNEDEELRSMGVTPPED